MTPAELDLLAKRLEAWLAPEDIIGSVNSLAKNPTDANKPATIVLSSTVLTPEADGGLFQLCKEYLQHFSVPTSLISLLKNVTQDFSLDDTWSLLENAHFTGTIEPWRAEVAAQPNSVLQVTDKDFLVDILIQPLKGLQGMVATCATNWTKLKQAGISPDNVYHQHRSPEPFAVWLDAYVASHCGFPDIGRSDWLQRIGGPNIRYRAITIQNYHHDRDSRMLTITRETSKGQANSTLQPI